MSTDVDVRVPSEEELEAAMPPDPDDYPTFLGMPLNRVLTIARGPINVAAGSVASWLLVHVHLLGLFHLQHDGLSAGIAQGLIFLLTAVLTDRGIAQWVKGHHIALEAQSLVAAAAAQPVQVTPPAGAFTPGSPYPEHYDAETAQLPEVTASGLPVSPDIQFSSETGGVG